LVSLLILQQRGSHREVVAKHVVNEGSLLLFWVPRKIVRLKLLAIFFCETFASLLFLSLLLSLELVHAFEIVCHSWPIVFIASTRPLCLSLIFAAGGTDLRIQFILVVALRAFDFKVSRYLIFQVLLLNDFNFLCCLYSDLLGKWMKAFKYFIDLMRKD
jgi:hypothetical protein